MSEEAASGPRVLLTSDDGDVSARIRSWLTDQGVVAADDVDTAQNDYDAARRFEGGYWDAVIAVVGAGGDGSRELIERIKAADPPCPVIVVFEADSEAAAAAWGDLPLVHLAPWAEWTPTGLAAAVRFSSAARRAGRNESRRRYNRLVQDAPLGMVAAYPDGLIQDYNRKLLDILGLPQDDNIQGASVFDHPALADSCLADIIVRAVHSGTPAIEEAELVRPNASRVHLRCHVQPVADAAGRTALVQVLIEDISIAKKLEDHMRQAQKMEAVGTLAGGIAHDFNNILGAIMGYTELSLLDVDTDTQLHQNLEQVLVAGRRAKELVSQILTFSRKNDQRFSRLEMGPILKEAVKFIRSSLPSAIEIRTHIVDRPLTVNADPTQIHQLIMNLCANAEHAMRERGGVLEIGLEECVATPADLDLPEIEAGRFMEMTVSDSGHGIQQRFLSRIFEPFFTTKNVGEGTGMGLSVVHGIVKSHGGAIKVFSQPDRGATFKIYLPLIPDRAAENEVLLPAMTGGDERILMVDDEAALVDVGGKMLRRLGYQVTAHIDGEAALRDFAQSPEAFDLVITDQTMPHLTGAELAERFRAVRADVPVVLCTGYNQHLNAASARDLGFDAFLLKPIILNDMARVIRAVLDEKWLRSSSD